MWSVFVQGAATTVVEMPMRATVLVRMLLHDD
jgi:hypothetical protein